MKKTSKIVLAIIITLILVSLLMIIYVFAGKNIESKKLFQTTDREEGTLLKMSYLNNGENIIYDYGNKEDNTVVYRNKYNREGGYENEVSQLFYITEGNEEENIFPQKDFRYIKVFGDHLGNWFSVFWNRDFSEISVYKLEGQSVKEIVFENVKPWDKFLMHNKKGEWSALLTKPYKIKDSSENTFYSIDMNNLKAIKNEKISGSNSDILINEDGEWFFWNRFYTSDGTFGPGASFLYHIKNNGDPERIKLKGMEICKLYNLKENCEVMKGYFFN
ncbi:hypothetical protein KKF55_01485 [Patescibacteria group bacterium]|nr:hypothetical protein [Patescibacteria group bacterium]